MSPLAKMGKKWRGSLRALKIAIKTIMINGNAKKDL